MTTDLNVPYEGIIKSEDLWPNWKLGEPLSAPFLTLWQARKSHRKLDTHHGLLVGKQTHSVPQEIHLSIVASSIDKMLFALGGD